MKKRHVILDIENGFVEKKIANVKFYVNIDKFDGKSLKDLIEHFEDCDLSKVYIDVEYPMWIGDSKNVFLSCEEATPGTFDLDSKIQTE